MRLICLFFFLLFSKAHALEVSARHAQLIDARSQSSLFVKNNEDKISSPTLLRLFVLHLLLNDLAKNQQTISHSFPTPSKSSNNFHDVNSLALKEGQILTLNEVAFALLNKRSLEATYVLEASYFKGEEGFLNRLNELVSRYNLSATIFKKQDGHVQLDQTSVQDLTRILNTMPLEILYRLSAQNTIKLGNTTHYKQNPLLVLGAETLFQESTSRATLLIGLTIDKERPLFVILQGQGQENLVEDARKLFDTGFINYEYKTLYAANAPLGLLAVKNAQPAHVQVMSLTPVAITYPIDKELKFELRAKEGLKPPFKQGVDIGQFIISIEGTPIKEVNVVAMQDVQSAGIWARLRAFFQ